MVFPGRIRSGVDPCTPTLGTAQYTFLLQQFERFGHCAFADLITFAQLIDPGQLGTMWVYSRVNGLGQRIAQFLIQWPVDIVFPHLIPYMICMLELYSKNMKKSSISVVFEAIQLRQ